MIELFDDLTMEQKLNVLTQLNCVIEEIKGDDNMSVEQALLLLSNLVDTFDTEQEKEYCELTTRILLQKIEEEAKNDKENSTN